MLPRYIMSQQKSNKETMISPADIDETKEIEEEEVGEEVDTEEEE